MLVKLRDMREEDFSELHALRRDIPLQHLLLAHPPASPDEQATRAWIERRCAEQNGAFKVVEHNRTVAGFVQLAGVHRLDRYAYGGICLLASHRGKGAGAAAMQELMRLASRHGMRKLLLEVRVDNLNALALYDRLGFKRVGTLAGHYDDGRLLHDVILLEIFLRDVA